MVDGGGEVGVEMVGVEMVGSGGALSREGAELLEPAEV